MLKKARRLPTYKKVLLFAGGLAAVAVLGVGYVRYTRPESDFEKWKRTGGLKRRQQAAKAASQSPGLDRARRRLHAFAKDPPDYDAWAAAVGPESELSDYHANRARK